MGEENSPLLTSEKSKELNYKVKAGLFLTSAAGIGLFFGFGSALATVKKQDPKAFDQGLVGATTPRPSPAQLHQTGAALASRALLYGSIWAVSGCGIIFYGIWKLIGAKDLEEFRYKIGSRLPRIPKNDPPQSRTEFSGINDFLQYVIDLDNENKKAKQEASSDGTMNLLNTNTNLVSNFWISNQRTCTESF